MFLRVLACIFLILLCSHAFATLPVVSSSSHPDPDSWYGSQAAFVSWEPIEGASSYAYAYDPSPTTNPDGSSTTIATSLTLPAKLEGGYYFHVRPIGIEPSNPAHFRIQIDTTGPSQPQLTASQEDRGIRLEWVPSEDMLSGMKGYTIYRNLLTGFSIRDYGIKNLGLFSGTSHLDLNSIEEGRTYFYLLVPVDNAGNIGYISPERHAMAQNFCDLNIQIVPALSDDKTELVVSVTAGAPIYYSTLTLKTPDSQEHVLFKNQSNYTDWNGNFSLENVPQGDIFLELDAQEFYGENCDTNSLFVFDVVAPKVDFVFPKNFREELQGEVRIKASVTEEGDFKSGIERVEIFYDMNNNLVSLGLAEPDTNGYYSLDWNTETLGNDYYFVHVKALDRAGNLTEKKREVQIFNTGGLTLDANAQIVSAELQLKSLEQRKALLEGLGITSASFNELREQGIAELQRAKLALSERRFDDAMRNASDAKNLFSQATAVVDLSTVASEEFIYNKQQIELLLEAAEFPAEQIKDLAFLIRQSRVSRVLEVVKVIDSNTDYFKVSIIVSFDFSKTFLSDNNISAIQVVEFVPKDFALSSGQIASSIPFEVLDEDPKIAFFLDNEFFDSGQSIVYAVKDSFSEQEAMAFVSSSVVNKYVAPPVLVESKSAFAPTSAFPELLLVGIVFAVIIITILIIAFVIKKFSKTKKGL